MANSETVSVDVQADSQAVAQRVAEWLTDLAIQAPDRFTVALSGGSTPKVLYALLAQEPFKSRFPWAKVHWFWGDERWVPKDNSESNYKMVSENMLSKVEIPATNIHDIKTELASPEATADDYEKVLKEFYGQAQLDSKKPFFDVTFLGLGPDGHTASLFPGTKVLEEKSRWVSSVVGAKPEPRITLTYPLLDSSKQVAFLVTGKDKAEMLENVLERKPEFPASHVKPIGKIHWFIDQAAAQNLK
jgi:6-phosphogluconolactonase